MSKKEITYEEAKQAKEILIKYLEDGKEFTMVLDTGKDHNEVLAYLALTQAYFLD